MLNRFRFLIINIVLLLALFGSQWGRGIENARVQRADFLSKLPLAYLNWKFTDVAIPADELQILEPDASVIREYTSPDGGSAAELAVIAGHKKRSIHTPGFCMAGGGWEKLWERSMEMPVGGRTILVTRSLMSREGQQVMATYFFTDGDYCTDDLVQFQGMQMMKRFRSEIPLGALVRILVPVRSDPRIAEQISSDFAAATVPPVLASLRNTHLHVY